MHLLNISLIHISWKNKNKFTKGPSWSWSWSHGSWIYNYLSNHCLSPPKLWIRIPLMARCTRCNIMWSIL